MRNPEQPTCSSSWASVPWRRPRPTREPSRPSRVNESENDRDNEDAIDLTASSSHLPSAPPLPPFEEGIRTWGELIGILDPMDDAEQIIDPLVVSNGVDRIRRMSAEERSGLSIQLVRFLAILYAEILRMLQMVDQGDGTSLLQLPPKGTKIAPGHALREDAMEDSFSLMQKGVDKFGALLQKLLGLFEKLERPQASVRARFLLAMLADVQRPGPHVSGTVVEKMDRLDPGALVIVQGGRESRCL